MENHSPLKSWVRKHSPIRSKPLPAPPVAASSPTADRTFREISGNSSPSKRLSKSKLRSFLRQKPQPPTPPRSSPPAQRPQSHEGRFRAATPPIEPSQQRSSIRKSLRTRRASHDLRGLSQKISSLEAQLQEARRELDHVSRSASNPHYEPDYVEHEERKPRSRHRQGLGEAEQQRERFVEDSLSQRDRDNDRPRKTRKTMADLSDAYIGHSAFEHAGHEHDAGFSDAEVIQHKKRRSEVRQASWERVQDHLQKQQKLQQNAPDTKKPRQSDGKILDSVSPRSKELPQLPDFPMPNSHSSSDFVIQNSAEEDAEDNGCPPLNRHQRSFSQPPTATSIPAPKQTKHRRRRSQIIEHEQLKEAFGDSAKHLDQIQAHRDAQPAFNGQPRKVNPPSPSRRHCPSPARLDKVEEEYEWDEDVF